MSYLTAEIPNSHGAAAPEPAGVSMTLECNSTLQCRAQLPGHDPAASSLHRVAPPSPASRLRLRAINVSQSRESCCRASSQLQEAPCDGQQLKRTTVPPVNTKPTSPFIASMDVLERLDILARRASLPALDTHFLAVSLSSLGTAAAAAAARCSGAEDGPMAPLHGGIQDSLYAKAAIQQSMKEGICSTPSALLQISGAMGPKRFGGDGWGRSPRVPVGTAVQPMPSPSRRAQPLRVSKHACYYLSEASLMGREEDYAGHAHDEDDASRDSNISPGAASTATGSGSRGIPVGLLRRQRRIDAGSSATQAMENSSRRTSASSTAMPDGKDMTAEQRQPEHPAIGLLKAVEDSLLAYCNAVDRVLEVVRHRELVWAALQRFLFCVELAMQRSTASRKTVSNSRNTEEEILPLSTRIKRTNRDDTSALYYHCGTGVLSAKMDKDRRSTAEDASSLSLLEAAAVGTASSTTAEKARVPAQMVAEVHRQSSKRSSVDVVPRPPLSSSQSAHLPLYWSSKRDASASTSAPVTPQAAVLHHVVHEIAANQAVLPPTPPQLSCSAQHHLNKQFTSSFLQIGRPPSVQRTMKVETKQRSRQLQKGRDDCIKSCQTTQHSAGESKRSCSAAEAIATPPNLCIHARVPDGVDEVIPRYAYVAGAHHYLFYLQRTTLAVVEAIELLRGSHLCTTPPFVVEHHNYLLTILIQVQELSSSAALHFALTGETAEDSSDDLHCPSPSLSAVPLPRQRRGTSLTDSTISSQQSLLDHSSLTRKRKRSLTAELLRSPLLSSWADLSPHAPPPFSLQYFDALLGGEAHPARHCSPPTTSGRLTSPPLPLKAATEAPFSIRSPLSASLCRRATADERLSSAGNTPCSPPPPLREVQPSHQLFLPPELIATYDQRSSAGKNVAVVAAPPGKSRISSRRLFAAEQYLHGEINRQLSYLKSSMTGALAGEYPLHCRFLAMMQNLLEAVPQRGGRGSTVRRRHHQFIRDAQQSSSAGPSSHRRPLSSRGAPALRSRSGSPSSPAAAAMAPRRRCTATVALKDATLHREWMEELKTLWQFLVEGSSLVAWE